MCLIFFFFDFRFCCYCGGLSGGVLVDFGGNGAMGVVFFLFSIWILGGWWWVVLFLVGGGGWTKWWLGADLCFPFLKIGFLHVRPNTRNNFPA